LYGAIAEEVLTRFGFLTAGAFVIALVFNAVGWPAGQASLVLGTVAAAAAFGLGHLPSTALLTPLTARLVLRSLLLNGLAGLVFGTLYCIYGLEAAIIAHGSANLVIQFVSPLSRSR